MAIKKKSKGTVKVNFKGVEAGGGGARVPEARYLARPIEAEMAEGNAGDYIAWIWQITEGKYKGKKLYDNTSLAPQALWRLRNVLEALDIDVPDGPMEVDYEGICADKKLVACIETEDGDYKGKPKSRIIGVYPADDIGDGGDKEEEEGDEEEEVDLDELDEDDLEKFVEKHDLDLDLSDFKTLSKKRAAVAKAMETAEEEEPEKEEEEETTSKKGKKKPADDEEEEEKETPDVSEMDEEELAEIVDEHNLEVDLDEFSTLKKKRAAVAEALEGAGDKEGEEEAEDDDGAVTQEALDEMGTSEMEALIKKHKLKVKLIGSTSKKRRTLKKALIEAELFEAGDEE